MKPCYCSALQLLGEIRATSVSTPQPLTMRPHHHHIVSAVIIMVIIIIININTTTSTGQSIIIWKWFKIIGKYFVGSNVSSGFILNSSTPTREVGFSPWNYMFYSSV